MTDLDHEANEAARHGNREALEAMTARCERLEAFVKNFTEFPIIVFHVDGQDFVLADVVREILADARAALSDKGDG